MSQPQTIIRDKALVQDDWQLLDDEAGLPDNEQVIVSWERWQSLLEAEQDDGRLPHVGVQIPNTLDLTEGWAQLQVRPVIALTFPAFPDGRAYSQARLLRDRYRFQGEVRAYGDAVVRDQLEFMARCGINAFVLRGDQDAEACLAAFHSFSDAYQPACDGVEPIWKRRRVAG